jgi:peptide/nickel transport system permease protein
MGRADAPVQTAIDREELTGVVRTPTRQALRRFLRNRLALLGIIIFLLFVLLVAGAPLFTHYSPDAIDLTSLNQDPTAQHPFGTDQIGRDTFTRTLYAGRVSLSVGVAATLISLIIGTAMGALAGFAGGVVDLVVSRLVDIVMALPSIVVLLTLATIVGPGLTTTIVVIGLVSWPLPCRLVRAKFLLLREQEFILAARAFGVPTWRIVLLHALPNVIDVIVVYGSLSVASAILTEAGLSFLGEGIQPPTASWGNMINAARDIATLQGYPWQWAPAGMAILITVLSINFIGDGLRDALDPRMKT